MMKHDSDKGATRPMDATDRRIVNALQDGVAPTERPYRDAARRLGLTEEDLLARLERLLEEGVLTRFGPMFDVEKMGGAFCLCAMSVPEADMARVVAALDARPEVAHNYERDHALNLWFVLATDREDAIRPAIESIEAETGLAVLDFPKRREFFVGLRVQA